MRGDDARALMSLYCDCMAQACFGGTYAAMTGSSTCTPCGAGRFANITEAKASDVCQGCVGGWFSTAVGALSNATCIACDAGRFSNLTAAPSESACESCPPSRYSNVSGATTNDTCSMCPPGVLCAVTTVYEVFSTVALVGISKADFNPAAQVNFRATIASGSGDVCGSSGSGNCSIEDIRISSFARRTVTNLAVQYVLQVYTADASLNASDTLQEYTSQNSFVNDLHAQGGTLAAVSSIVVTAPPNNRTTIIPSADGKACPRGKYCPTGSYLPVACSAGTHSNVSGATTNSTCQNCTAGQFSNSGAPLCSLCPAGRFVDTDAAPVCKDCTAGRWTNETGLDTLDDCIQCPSGKFSDAEGATENSTCQDCVPGRYSTLAGGHDVSTCLPCPAGKYVGTNGSTGCHDCGKGKFSMVLAATESTTCSPCPGGTYAFSTGTVNCTKCKGGTFSATIGGTSKYVCLSCPGGKYSSVLGATLSSTCLACPPARYVGQSGMSVCTACASGKFSTVSGATAEYHCSDCDVGRYANASGTSSCRHCMAGKKSDAKGAVTESTCVWCTAGRYTSNQGHSECSSCVPGQFAATYGSRSCMNCDVASFSSIPGASTCQLCEAGTFSNFTGRSFCDLCLPGRYSTSIGTHSVHSCLACPSGRASSVAGAPSSATCTQCSAGRFAEFTAQSVCTRCRNGWIGIQVGGTSNSTCTACQPGMYGLFNDSTKCFACPMGKHQPGFGGGTFSSCIDCSPGWYGEVSGSSSCDMCLAGMFSPVTAAISKITCQPCPGGTYCADASAQPTLCPAAHYSPRITAQSSRTCQACPARMNSYPGASNMTDCQVMWTLHAGQCVDSGCSDDNTGFLEAPSEAVRCFCPTGTCPFDAMENVPSDGVMGIQRATKCGSEGLVPAGSGCFNTKNDHCHPYHYYSTGRRYECRFRDGLDVWICPEVHCVTLEDGGTDWTGDVCVVVSSIGWFIYTFLLLLMMTAMLSVAVVNRRQHNTVEAQVGLSTKDVKEIWESWKEDRPDLALLYEAIVQGDVPEVLRHLADCKVSELEELIPTWIQLEPPADVAQAYANEGKSLTCAEALLVPLKDFALMQWTADDPQVDWCNNPQVVEPQLKSSQLRLVYGNMVHLASWVGNVEIFQLLIKEGTDLNLPNEDGQTVLHVVARRPHQNHVALLKMLLIDEAASPEKVDRQGKKPVDCASGAGHLEAARYLAERSDGVSKARLVGICTLLIWLADICTDVMVTWDLFENEPYYFTTSTFFILLPGVVHCMADLIFGGTGMHAVLALLQIGVPVEAVSCIRANTRTARFRTAVLLRTLFQSFPSALLQLYLALYLTSTSQIRLLAVGTSILSVVLNTSLEPEGKKMPHLVILATYRIAEVASRIISVSVFFASSNPAVVCTCLILEFGVYVGIHVQHTRRLWGLQSMSMNFMEAFVFPFVNWIGVYVDQEVSLNIPSWVELDAPYRHFVGKITFEKVCVLVGVRSMAQLVYIAISVTGEMPSSDIMEGMLIPIAAVGTVWLSIAVALLRYFRYSKADVINIAVDDLQSELAQKEGERDEVAKSIQDLIGRAARKADADDEEDNKALFEEKTRLERRHIALGIEMKQVHMEMGELEIAKMESWAVKSQLEDRKKKLGATADRMQIVQMKLDDFYRERKTKAPRPLIRAGTDATGWNLEYNVDYAYTGWQKKLMTDMRDTSRAQSIVKGQVDKIPPEIDLIRSCLTQKGVKASEKLKRSREIVSLEAKQMEHNMKLAKFDEELKTLMDLADMLEDIEHLPFQFKAEAAEVVKLTAEVKHRNRKSTVAARGEEEFDVDAMIANMYHRYDLDGSGLIDGDDELRMLVTNVVFKLAAVQQDAMMSATELERKLDDWCAKRDFEADPLNLAEFRVWFRDEFMV